MSNTSGAGTDRSVGDEIQALYGELAEHPEKDYGWGKGVENARALGYGEWLARLPARVWESAAAVGNPFSLGGIHPGETVIDLGCGAGADVCVAALLVGPQGKVVGIDLTPAMAEKARANAALSGLDNVEIVEGDIAELTLPDGMADVVISNGAINLSPRKACVLKGAMRILKPGGRLYVADMIADEAAAPAARCPSSHDDSWAHCVAGTITAARFLEMLREAGFASAELVGTTAYRTSPLTIGAMFRAVK